MKKTRITMQEVDNAAWLCSERWTGRPVEAVVGIPNGGCTPAALVAGHLRVKVRDWRDDKLDPHVLVVDDLVATGKTLKMAMALGVLVDALFRKPLAPADLAPHAVPKDGWLVFPWEDSSGGPEDAVTRLIEFVGEDPNREGLADTPGRVLRAYEELTAGYQVNVADLFRTFTETCDEMVMVRDIEFTSLCEHHLLPFTGTATVAYIPNQKVVGLSKLARLVDAYARRLQVQERMTGQIAQAIQEHLQPGGVGVVVRARHACMACRGVKQPTAEMVTSAVLGALRDKPAARAEFLAVAQR